MWSTVRDFTSDAAAAVFGWPWAARALQDLARVGYMARGLVYFLVGWLAAASAFNKARPLSVGGALSAVSDLSAGWIVVAAISLGLLAYALWRLAEAVLDISDRGWDGKGLLLRACMLGDALVQACLGLLAGTVALGWTGLIDEERTIAEIGAASALDWPLGHWILGMVGLGAVAIGFGQVAKARRTAFEGICTAERNMAAIRVLGRIGLGARGLIFAVIGALFLAAAWQADATTAGGLRAALRALAALPLGGWVLLAMSAGLAVYGVFGLIKGWCHERPSP
jgi:hypothetical protein